MNVRLLPCPSCLRHVRASEACCPFCAEGVEFPQTDAPKTSWADTRLSRSARVALGVALATTTLPGCGGSGANAPPNPPAPVYGGPPAIEEPPPEESMPLEPEPGHPGGGEFAQPPDGQLGPGPDAGAMRPKYGAPPPPPDEGGMRPKYGAPPPPDPGGVKALYGVPPNPDN